MEIIKASLTLDGSSITLDVPFVKVDEEKRLVSGFATLDNLDSQGDIVTQEASMKAFKNFRGNIREMHQPKAVGKIVDYRPDHYIDKTSGEVYNGIYVSAYISKGASDTWEKVLDGTLSGFSIGGELKKSEPLFSEKADSIHRKISEYDLVELSLVDNPANKFANVLVIQKSDDTPTILTKTTVHWCDKDGILTVDDVQPRCPVCNKSMHPVGFIEEEPTKDVLKGILKRYKDEQSAGDSTILASEEVAVDDLAKSTDNPKEDTMAQEDSVETEVVKSDSPETGDADLVKTVNATADSVKSLVEAVAGLSELTGMVKTLAETINGLKKSIDAVSTEVADVKSEVTEVKADVEKFDGRVEAVEADTAVKKSSDVGGITEQPHFTKSKWGGRFLGSTSLYQ